MGPRVFPIDPSSQQTPPSLPAAGGRQQGPSSAEISGEHHPAVAIALPLLLAIYLPGPPSVSDRRWPAVSACCKRGAASDISLLGILSYDQQLKAR